ncbi:orotate phosphoribosyltransferase [Maribacter sp. 2307ULW6-5]|uniref:orotate phosphoribosyltransferase n=1 Tax=Maribacter sp. 2307ULW6-5 TaxID=3386275 RepID=UPI0039BC56CD
MVLDKHTAKKTAELLLQINAIKLRPENPFSWASGWKSPIYCDNRVLLSYPAIRNYIKEQMAKQVDAHYGKPDVIAGVATGAIGMGALVADTMGLPFVYVRPEPKAHGRKNQIEGHLEPHRNVVVIEDLISTGMSSLNAVKALREGQANVKGMVAVFTYGFEVAKDNFEAQRVTLSTLSSYEFLLEQALDSNYVNMEQRDTLMEWRKNPSQWKK